MHAGCWQETRGGSCGSQEPAEDAGDGDPKANAKFVSSIATQEKLKTEFDVERKAWVEEKAALVTRAEQAEKALAEKTAELSGLKRQVSQMVAAIFGKSPHRLSSSSYMS